MERREGGTEEETKGRDEWNGKVGRGLLGEGRVEGQSNYHHLRIFIFVITSFVSFFIHSVYLVCLFRISFVPKVALDMVKYPSIMVKRVFSNQVSEHCKTLSLPCSKRTFSQPSQEKSITY